MAITPFQKIRDVETPEKSYRWYQDMIRKVGLGSVSANRVMKSDIGEFVTKVEMGDMYLFLYDPKTAEKLPYYDVAPLVAVFRRVPDGFYGLNFHYLPPMLRMRLLDRMMQYTTDETLSEKTKFTLKWQLLDNASKFPGVHACVKRYLYNHVSSRLLKVYPQDWRKVIMLPIDSFEKASRNVVFTDSRSKM